MNRCTRRGLLVAMAWCALVAPAQAADLEVRNLSTDRYFTPNGDGSEDIGRVTYGLSNAANVDVTITDTNGAVVRKVLNHAAQPEAWSDNEFTWNGLDDAGNEAPAGGATFAVTGKDAPPRVTLTAPDGLKITTPAGGAGISNDRVLLFQNTADKTTYVAVKSPAAGNWRIDPLPGSATVTGVRHANGLPEPQVRGRVVASGRKRTLRYTVKPIPGQRVEFTERMPGGRVRVLGTARGRRGRIAIKPAPGPRGKRRIVAQVLQYDLPREELAVASYSPPRNPSGRVKRLRLTARGGRLKASWKRVAGAKAYRVAVKVSDGRRLLYLDVRRPSLTIPRVTGGMRVTVQVRAAALPTGTPPTTSKSIKVKR